MEKIKLEEKNFTFKKIKFEKDIKSEDDKEKIEKGKKIKILLKFKSSN